MYATVAILDNVPQGKNKVLMPAPSKDELSKILFDDHCCQKDDLQISHVKLLKAVKCANVNYLISIVSFGILLISKLKGQASMCISEMRK